MHKKNDLEKIYKVLRSHLFILFIFLILSVLSVSILWKSQLVGWSDDAHFHWSRIYDLRRSIEYGNLFPDVAINKFFESGVVVMSMYPKLNLYPIVALSFFIKSFTNLVYVTFILKTFLSLLIGYISCYHINRSRKISFVFSVSYSLSSVFLCYSFGNMDMGVSSSLIFFPLVLFGLYELINTKTKWRELCIGITFIILCHVLTAIMMILLVSIIIILNYSCLKDRKFILSLLKIILVSLMITSIFWLPFITILSRNNISFVDTYTLSGTDFNSFIRSIFSNSVLTPIYINIFAFIGLILGIINYKKMSKFTKQIFWISTFLLLVSSSIFPWNILSDTFIKIIQFTWRLYIVPQLLLTYIFAVNFISFFKGRKQLAIALFVLILSVMCIQMIGQEEIKDHYNVYISKENIIKDNNIFEKDYRPKNSNPIINIVAKHEGTYGKIHHINVNRLENGKFSFKLSRNVYSLNLPFFIFNGIDYRIKVDGNDVNFRVDKYSCLQINELRKGSHNVQVIVKKSWYDYLSYVLSVLGIIIFLFCDFRLNNKFNYL